MFITNVTVNTYQSRLNAGFPKVCEILKVCAIESLKFIREFHPRVCYCGDIFTPRNLTLNETNCDWLFDVLVKRPHEWALTNKCNHILLRKTNEMKTAVLLDVFVETVIHFFNNRLYNRIERIEISKQKLFFRNRN